MKQSRNVTAAAAAKRKPGRPDLGSTPLSTRFRAHEIAAILAWRNKSGLGALSIQQTIRMIVTRHLGVEATR